MALSDIRLNKSDIFILINIASSKHRDKEIDQLQCQKKRVTYYNILIPSRDNSVGNQEKNNLFK